MLGDAEKVQLPNRLAKMYGESPKVRPGEAKLRDMTIGDNKLWSRRHLLSRWVAAGGVLFAGAAASTERSSDAGNRIDHEYHGEILGQGNFRYRAHRFWGRLDRRQHPVRDCHGISGDRKGRIVTLTNETRNNLIAYNKAGGLIAAWEHRFPGAHGLDIVDHKGSDQYWITDHVRQQISVCSADGEELLRVGPEVLSSKYSDITKYHPTNTATLPDGDFFIADGYGSSFIHHLDPDGHYISSFGGTGTAPENLDTPHAISIDARSGNPRLLVCDRGHNMLKWFSLDGELLKIVSLGASEKDAEPIGAGPSNVAQFGEYLGGRFKDHLAIACLGGMVVILNGEDRVVSAVGGMPPVYREGELQQLETFNYTFNHPHDVYVDAAGALYVAQWWSNQTYPIKLELVDHVS